MMEKTVNIVDSNCAEETLNFGTLMGFEYRKVGDNAAIIALKVDRQHCNLHGSVHGGVILALADAAGYWAGAQNGAPIPGSSTASLNCNFLRGTTREKTEELRAEAQITKWGRTMYFSTITVYASPAETVIASLQGVYSVPRNPDSTPPAA